MGLEHLIRNVTRTITYGAIALFGYACSGNATPNNQPNTDADGYSTNDPGYSQETKPYDTIPSLDTPIDDVKQEDILPDVAPIDVPVIDSYDAGDDTPTEADDGSTWLDSDLLEEVDAGLDALVDALDVEQDVDTGMVPETTSETSDDTTIDAVETTVDTPIVSTKKNVSISVQDVITGNSIDNLTYTVKDVDGKLITTGTGKTASLELEPATYTITITDNLVKATEFEYITGKKLTLTGEYQTDFNALLTTMTTEGLSTEIKNTTIALFNNSVIGSYFDLEFVIDVTDNMDVKKQMVANFTLDVPCVLEDGTVNVENAADFVAKYLGLFPFIEDGYTRPLQWNTAPNPLNIYVEEATSTDGTINLKQAFLDGMKDWETKANMTLYTLVTTKEEAQITATFDGTTKSVTIHQYDTNSDPVTIASANIQIKPKDTYDENKSISAHELYHTRTGLSFESTIEGTIAKNPLNGFVTNIEGKTIAIAVRSTTLNTTEILYK